MKTKASYFRNMIFGAEDSLVSTVGVLFGVASTAYDKNLIIVTGLIVIAVEATSMGAGAFLSEKSTQEFESKVKEGDENNPYFDGIIMCLSYFLAGFIPLTPYVLFSSEIAKILSVGASLLSLFLLGYIPYKSLKAGVRMASVAGVAIFLGFIIGTLSNIYI